MQRSQEVRRIGWTRLGLATEETRRNLQNRSVNEFRWRDLDLFPGSRAQTQHDDGQMFRPVHTVFTANGRLKRSMPSLDQPVRLGVVSGSPEVLNAEHSCQLGEEGGLKLAALICSDVRWYTETGDPTT